jgi:P27 family predicted phage terminase small subunit
MPRYDIVEENISAPSYFAPEDRKLFDKLASEYCIRDNTSAQILEIAIASRARARAMREQIKKDGLMIEGPNGSRCHPLITQERHALQQMISAFRRLGVHVDE